MTTIPLLGSETWLVLDLPPGLRGDRTRNSSSTIAPTTCLPSGTDSRKGIGLGLLAFTFVLPVIY